MCIYMADTCEQSTVCIQKTQLIDEGCIENGGIIQTDEFVCNEADEGYVIGVFGKLRSCLSALTYFALLLWQVHGLKQDHIV